MKILSVNNVVNQNKTVSSDNRPRKIMYQTNQTANTVSFGSWQYIMYEPQLLDKYINNFLKIRKIRNTMSKESKELEALFCSEINTINNKIKPLLEDKSFLWKSQSDGSKKEYMRFLHNYIIKNNDGINIKKAENDGFELIYKKIYDAIMLGDPRKVTLADINSTEDVNSVILLRILKHLMEQKKEAFSANETIKEYVISYNNQIIKDKLTENTDIYMRFFDSGSSRKFKNMKKHWINANKLITERLIERKILPYELYIKYYNAYCKCSRNKIALEANIYANDAFVRTLKGEPPQFIDSIKT